MQSSSTTTSTARILGSVVCAECAVVLALGVLAACLDVRLAESAVVGGLLFVIPNAYFTLYAFRYRGAGWSQLIPLSFNKGLMGKLMLTAAGFAVVFHFNTPNILALFGSYCLLLVIHVWVAHRVSNRISAETAARAPVVETD